MSGKYEIIAVAEGDGIYDDITLGTIYVEESPLFIVTTLSDIENKYDGVVSLREAVSYIKEYGGEEDEVIFNNDVNYVFLNKPLMIDADVKIKGNFNEYRQNYTIIYGSKETQLINVTEGGSLECESIVLHSGYSKEYGGAVENKGGSVYLKNCNLVYNKSGTAGGAIYSDGGSVKLLNCAFKENTSGYGGAIALSGNARLDMLNCSVFNNTSNSGAVYNNSGEANIIYSIFADNTASSSGGGAITSFGKTNLVGSIASLNGDTDLDGNVSVYGSYITNSSDKVTVDASSIQGSGYRIFSCTSEGKSDWYLNEALNKVSYNTALSPFIKEGIYVKSIDDKLAYSTDNTEWTATDIPSVFTDEAYKADIYGNSHGRLFGSLSEACEDAQFICIEANKAYIYVPAAQDAVLIEKRETYDNILTGVNVYDVSLDIGTNVIDLKNTDTEDSITTYMLWDSLETMRPLTAAFNN